MKQRHTMQQGSLLDIPTPERKERMPSQPEIEKKMSRLEELIAELCPDGVEYKKLEEVCEFVTGFSFKSSLFKEIGTPICKTTNIADGYISFEGMNCFDISDYKEKLDKFIIRKNDIVIGMSGTIKVGINNRDSICYLNQRVGKFVPNIKILNNKFLYYLLCNTIKTIYENISGGSVINLSNNDIKKLSIPVPPLPIQEEIVRILDKFTELTAELTAELTKRKQQYQYYRNNLLFFKDDTIFKTIKDVCIKISSGGTPLKSKSNYYNGNIPWLRTQEVKFCDITKTEMTISQEGIENSSAKWIPENCVIVAISGATAARCAINKIPLTTNQHCCNLEINPQIASYRYVFHWISSQHEKLKSLGQGAREDLNIGIISSYPIPVPPLAEQQRIVSILDRFDALCNDLTSGLPAEIEARKKQYEYYRDKLLSFPEKPRESAS